MSTMSAPLPSPLMQRLLARYLTSLAKNPLKIKAITTGILFFLQEILAHYLSGAGKVDYISKDGLIGRMLPSGVREGLREVGVSGKAVQVRELRH